jgi:RNA polymerase sigma factor, sigma-70 family
MEFTENLIGEYSKRIYGFAYSKTRNYHDAQDLSQTILTVLCEMDFSDKNIGDMDSYIYRVCRYTWSNYLRNNKRHWEGMRYADEIKAVVSDEDIENKLIQKELFRKLRREIMYLGKTKRDVTNLFYFENKSGDDISAILGIPASTVRWHLGESKKILKERIDMTDNIYIPRKLEVYFSGVSGDVGLKGLRGDLLVHNICIMCHGKALTIEEISSSIGVAAAYVEDKLKSLIDMNYIRKVGSNKYQTNFYIKDEKYTLAERAFGYEHYPAIAKSIAAKAKKQLPDIRKIGFNGCDLGENFLMWDLITKTAHELFCSYIRNLPNVIPPVRGDGSSFWIQAAYADEELFANPDAIDADFREYITDAKGAGAKYSASGNYLMEQFDPKICIKYRNDDYDVTKLHEMKDITGKVQSLNSSDEAAIAELIKKGYVQTTDGKPELLIPCLTADEKAKLDEIINAIVAEVRIEISSDLHDDYKKHVKKEIPSFVSDDEKDFMASYFYDPLAVTWFAYKTAISPSLRTMRKSAFAR